MRTRVFWFLAFLVMFLATGDLLAQSLEDDVKKYPSCQYCGMNREQFAQSRVFITYDDGSSMGACSIHCAAVDLAVNVDKTPKSLQVGDYKTKNLIDAENASWVVGGNKPGVMTKRAKWAFRDKADADAFVQENGGVVATFDDAMKAAYEDMYNDTKMIREKRAMKKKMQTEGHPQGAAEHKHQ